MSSLIQQPSQNILRASDKLCFTLWQFDIGDEIVEKQGIYQLKCVDTDEWLMKQPSMFRGDKQLPINLIDLVTCRLRLTVPTPIEKGLIEDTTGKKKVQLHYGDAVHDSEDCENNSCEFTGTSQEFTIINSYCPPYEPTVIREGEILANMPETITVCRNTCDWIWICGEADITLQINTIDGQFTSNTYTTPTDSLHYLSVGPENIEIGSTGPATGLIDRDKISCIKILRNNVLVSKISVIKCCCEDDDQLLFLDPKGSIRGMGTFECAESRDVQTGGSVICRQSACNVPLKEMMAYFGQKYMAKESWEHITLKQKFCIDDSNEKFFRAFNSSPAYWIKRKDCIVGFIPDSRPTTFRGEDGQTEITISGHIAWQLGTQQTN